MAYTQAQLAKLEAAIARGARSYEYDGNRIVYHSLAEMRALRDEIRRELGLAHGVRSKVAKHTKGLGGS